MEVCNILLNSQIHNLLVRNNATLWRKCLFSLKCYLSFNPYQEQTTELDKQYFPVKGYLAGRLAHLVQRRTREHYVSGHYRYEFVFPADQIKLLLVFRMRR